MSLVCVVSPLFGWCPGPPCAFWSQLAGAPTEKNVRPKRKKKFECRGRDWDLGEKIEHALGRGEPVSGVVSAFQFPVFWFFSQAHSATGCSKLGYVPTATGKCQVRLHPSFHLHVFAFFGKFTSRLRIHLLPPPTINHPTWTTNHNHYNHPKPNSDPQPFQKILSPTPFVETFYHSSFIIEVVTVSPRLRITRLLAQEKIRFSVAPPVIDRKKALTCPSPRRDPLTRAFPLRHIRPRDLVSL